MIELQTVPLPGKSQDALAEWLSDPACQTALQVAEAKVKEYQVAAVNAAVTAAKGAPAKIEVTNRALELAVRYEHFIAVLTEFRDSQSPATTVKLS